MLASAAKIFGHTRHFFSLCSFRFVLDRREDYRQFGYQKPELYRHYVRFNFLIAHSKALGD